MCCTSATLPFILSPLDTPLRWGRTHPSAHHHSYGTSPEEPPLFMDDSQQNLMMRMGPQWGWRGAEKWVRCRLASLQLNQSPKTSRTRSWSLQKHHSCVPQWGQTDGWVRKDKKTKRESQQQWGETLPTFRYPPGDRLKTRGCLFGARQQPAGRDSVYSQHTLSHTQTSHLFIFTLLRPLLQQGGEDPSQLRGGACGGAAPSQRSTEVEQVPPFSSSSGLLFSPLFPLSSMCRSSHMLRLLPPLLSPSVEATNQMQTEDRDFAGNEWREDGFSTPSPFPCTPLQCVSLALIKTRGCAHSTHTHIQIVHGWINHECSDQRICLIINSTWWIQTQEGLIWF